MTDHLRLLTDEPLTEPPLYVVYSAEDHASMKLGIGLAATLISLPGCSSADRALAASELCGVLNRMEGKS